MKSSLSLITHPRYSLPPSLSSSYKTHLNSSLSLKKNNMEALNFLKFWKPTLSPTTTMNTKVPNFVVEIIDEEEEEDSFFELELTVPDFDTNQNNNREENKQIESKKEHNKNSANVGDVKDSKPSVSVSSNDHFSKRKILPIEPTFKPSSPISLLKSAPRFRVLSFKKSKSATTQKTGRTEKTELKAENSTPSMLPRDNSYRSVASNSQKQINTEETFSEYSSKRFSKDAMQKYLKLIKPLYEKVSRKNNEGVKFSGELSTGSPAMSPAKSLMGLPRKKKLGKSKSASASIGVASPARRDDSLLLQHDAIQNAILHCKRSFNSNDSSSLSVDWARNSSEEVNRFGI